jgi:CubicO group peptidase (beta-lactamase class C family)
MKGLALLFAITATAAIAEYPGQNWQPHSRKGWSEPLLAAARQYASTRKTLAVMVVQSGRVVDQWGPVDQKIEVRSIRKSFLSALYGIHVAEGRIDLGKTLGEVGIDDVPPVLTSVEKQATILDLLRARSGVYHDASRETPGMHARRPARGSHPPGSFFYYNNWDFNVLGAVFQKLTGAQIFEDFSERIAKPIGMNDFVPADGRFSSAPEGKDNLGGQSRYPNYIFSMTARDMARFGYLFLRNGKWEDRQVVPADWVTRSTTSYSDLDTFSAIGNQTGYGFLWWTEEWGYSAIGASGHIIAVIPKKDLVIVHRVAYDPPREDVVSYRDIDALMRIYIAAAPDIAR